MADGIFRFALEGKRPLADQPWPIKKPP